MRYVRNLAPQHSLIPGQGLNGRWDFTTRDASRAPRGVIGAGELFEKGFDIAAWHGREQSGNSSQTNPVPARSTVQPRYHSESTGDFRPVRYAKPGQPGGFCVVRMGRQNTGCLSGGPASHQEVVERGLRFGSVYIAKPGSKNAKEIRVDATSGQILAVQTERPEDQAEEPTKLLRDSL